MATRAFSMEDGNLATKSILATQKRTYKDIDLSFAKKTTGEIFKKTDAAAVKQAVKNVLLTSRLEKPFNPDFGAGLNRFLFDLNSKDYKSWAKGLKKAGYATDPDYSEKLISLIERFNLSQLD